MIHHVFANRSNIGDWYCAKGIQSLLAPAPIQEHLCDEPFVPETLTQLVAIEDGLVVIGGGGLFMSYFEPFWHGFRELLEGHPLPFVIWGVGVCDMKAHPSLPDLRLISEICARAALVCVRDALTREYLGSPPGATITGCPAFNAVAQRPVSGGGLMYADAYDNIGAACYEQVVGILQRYAAATGRPYRQTDNTVAKDDEGARQRLLDAYASSDVIVASRLHGCILAVALGRPVIAISGDRKVEAFMESAGLGRWVLGTQDVHQLPVALDDIGKQPSTLAYADAARQRNRQIAARVSTLLKPGAV